MAVRVFLLLLIVSASAYGQQMVVIKKGNIMTRYNLGEEIRFVLKGDKQMYKAAILSIREFEFVTLTKDTIKYNQIARLKFQNKGVKNYMKSTLIGAAGLTALHFALKEPYGDKNPQAVNGLAYAAGAGVVSSLFILATSRSHIKLNGFKRLKFINYDSPLYK